MVRSLSILGLINTIFLKNKWVKKEDIVFSITYVARLEIDKLDKTKSFIISLSYLLFKNSHPLFLKCIFKINYVQPSSTLNFNKEPALWNGNIFILDSIFLLSWANKKGNRIWIVLDRTLEKPSWWVWSSEILESSVGFVIQFLVQKGLNFRFEVCYVLVWSNTNPKILEFSNISLFWQLGRKIRGHKFDTFFSLFDWIAIDILSSTKMIILSLW